MKNDNVELLKTDKKQNASYNRFLVDDYQQSIVCALLSFSDEPIENYLDTPMRRRLLYNKKKQEIVIDEKELIRCFLSHNKRPVYPKILRKAINELMVGDCDSELLELVYLEKFKLKGKVMYRAYI